MPPSNGRQRAAAHRASMSCWRWPDLHLEHPQRIREEGGSIKHRRHVVVIGEEAGSIEHLIMSSSVRRPTVVDLVHEDDEKGRSTSTRREEGGTWKKLVTVRPNAMVVRL
jgi:hypothetical protein